MHLIKSNFVDSKSVSKYGCHNRTVSGGYYLMQRRYSAFGQYIMEQTYIKHTMTKECQWSKTHYSVRCEGCNRQYKGTENG